MILVDREMVFTDCYAETMSTRMELLKSIKYSTFEVSALNGIAVGYEPEMNISSIDLTRFCTALIGQT